MSVETNEKSPQKITRRTFLKKAGLVTMVAGLAGTGCSSLLKGGQVNLQEGVESVKSFLPQSEEKDPSKTERIEPLQLNSLEDLREKFYPQVRDLNRGFFLLWKPEYTPEQVARELSQMEPFYSTGQFLTEEEVEKLYHQKIQVTGKELLFIVPPETKEPARSPNPLEERAEWMTLTYEAPATKLCNLSNLADNLGVDAEELAKRNGLEVDGLIRGGTIIEIPVEQGFYPSQKARERKIRWFPNRLVHGWDISQIEWGKTGSSLNPKPGERGLISNPFGGYVAVEVVSSTSNFWNNDKIQEVQNLLHIDRLKDKEGKETLVFYGFLTKVKCLVEIPPEGMIEAGKWEESLLGPIA